MVLRIAFKLLRILFKGGALGSNFIAIPVGQKKDLESEENSQEPEGHDRALGWRMVTSSLTHDLSIESRPLVAICCNQSGLGMSLGMTRHLTNR